MMQNDILFVEFNRDYYCFDDSKVKEKRLRFSIGLTEYIPSICQLVNDWVASILILNLFHTNFDQYEYLHPIF